MHDLYDIFLIHRRVRRQDQHNNQQVDRDEEEDYHYDVDYEDVNNGTGVSAPKGLCGGPDKATECFLLILFSSLAICILILAAFAFFHYLHATSIQNRAHRNRPNDDLPMTNTTTARNAHDNSGVSAEQIFEDIVIQPATATT